MFKKFVRYFKRQSELGGHRVSAAEKFGLPASWEKYRAYVKVDPTAIIAPSATLTIFNPPNLPATMLEIGAYSHIFGHFALMTPSSCIRVGSRSQIGNSHFLCAENIEVGDDVLMAWNIVIMDNDAHSIHWEERKNDVRQCYEDYQSDPSNFIQRKNWSHVEKAAVHIGHRTWIGFNSCILKGVNIGDEAVLAAASVVTKNVEPRSMVGGNPAKFIKQI